MSSATREVANPRALPMPLVGLAALLVVVGVIAFFVGLSKDAATAWRAYHVNFLYFAGLAQGGLVISCILTTVNARWHGPVRRIAESLAAWVPVTVILFLVDRLGWEHIFEWIAHPVEKKAVWLNVTRVFWSNLAVFVGLAILSICFLYHSLRPGLKGSVEKASVAKGMFARWSANWRGDAEEAERSKVVTAKLAVALLFAFAFGYTLVGFDLVMSMEPLWYSNLFGAFFSWGAFLSAVCVTTLISVLHCASPGLAGHITVARRHDLGKMIFAFSIFWMYLFWSQYIVIWYSNLPEETGFLLDRLGSMFLIDNLPGRATYEWNFALERIATTPYGWLSMAVWACCWIIPFWGLLFQAPKKNPLSLGLIALIVASGLWLERNVLVWPSVEPSTAAWCGGIQFGIAAGFLGAFILVFLVYSRIFPSLLVPTSES